MYQILMIRLLFISHQNEKQCRFKKADIGATMTSYRKIKRESESDLQVAVGTVGPISVAMDASHRSFQVSSSLVVTLININNCQITLIHTHGGGGGRGG